MQPTALLTVIHINCSQILSNGKLRLASVKAVVVESRFKLISNPVITIISPPRFGALTVQGPSFAYTAGPDFRDENSFTLEVSGFIRRVSGTSTIRVAVSNIDGANPPPRE